MIRALGLAGVLALAACGGGHVTDPEHVVRGSSFVLAAAPAGLGQAVVADTIAWSPTVFRFAGDAGLEIEGVFRIRFRNQSDRALSLRYDLRFLDADGIFVDRFIPFGQPVALPAGGTVVGEGTFSLRSADLDLPDLLATMEVVA
ncbi:MAG: hypothetical protein ABIL09_12920, partial [Gemmatimonadota bacterium]